MKIAIEGCAHGELDKIYATIQHMEQTENFKIDLLICCGDFQAVRNEDDLSCMAVPQKYRTMQDFHLYYSGQKTAPILTIFIGGNHEATSYLAELPYGGWVCPNIFYMGYANVMKYGCIRIAGLSGIYKGQDYLKGHHESYPYNENTKRSAYHIRNVDVYRLKQLSGNIDIFLTHDWPRGVYHFGNTEQLLKRKPFFRQEVESNTLGSRPAEELLMKLQPNYWFSAHLHVKFAALVKHESSKVTQFLALDKCLPHRQFLQILDIPNEGEKPWQLQYDPEWLSILQSTNHLLSVKNCNQYMPSPTSPERWNFTPTEEELQNVNDLFKGDFTCPMNFEQTAKSFNLADRSSNQRRRSSYSSPDASPHRQGTSATCINPQTTSFCDKLGIDDPCALLLNAKEPLTSTKKSYMSPSGFAFCNETNSSLDTSATYASFVSSSPSLSSSINPDEISLEDDEEEDTEDVEDKDESDVDCDAKQGSCLKSPRSALQLPAATMSEKDDVPSKDESADVSQKANLSESKEQNIEELPLSSGLCFVLDRSGSHNSLSKSWPLPNEKDEECNIPVVGLGEKELEAEENNGNGSLKRCSPDLSSSGKKTFKRRNQAIYSTREDDEESL